MGLQPIPTLVALLALAAVTAWAFSDTDCPIKGNISWDGEAIYHVPGGRWYSSTRINILKGEQWFCTEAEAEAAGWRPAQR